jgi:hypothetical protein
LFFFSGTEVVFLTSLTTFRPQSTRPAQGGAVAVMHRRHGLEVEHEGHFKHYVVIFFFVEVLCNVRFFSLNAGCVSKKN